MTDQNDQIKLDEKTLIPIATALLIGIGAFKILLFGEHYHVAVYNYTNFSNLLEYTFDILRGLILYAIPVVVFILFKDFIIPFFKKPIVVCVSLAILCISALLFLYCYYSVAMTYCANMWVKGLLELGIFCAGVVIKSCKWVKNFDIAKFSLLLCFLYLYLKVENKYVIYGIETGKENKISRIVLKPIGNRDLTILTNRGLYLILNTSDFVFLYNDTSKSVTTIPMINIYSFTERIN